LQSAWIHYIITIIKKPFIHVWDEKLVSAVPPKLQSTFNLLTVSHRGNGPPPAHLIRAETNRLFRLLLTGDIQILFPAGFHRGFYVKSNPISLLSLRKMTESYWSDHRIFCIFILLFNKLYSEKTAYVKACIALSSVNLLLGIEKQMFFPSPLQ